MSRFQKFAAATVASLAFSGAALAGQFTIESGKTKPLKLKHDADSIVVGNPNIADVAVHNSKMLFISGKVFGTTNLLIFDKEGNTIYSADVVVTTNTANLVTINRAGSNYSYDCAPTCRAGLSVGDNAGHFDQVYNQMSQQQELSE